MKYKVVVTGHAPPFKWRLYFEVPADGKWRQAETVDTDFMSGQDGTGRTLVTKLMNCMGEAQTFEAALAAGREYAQQHNFEQTHASTVYEEQFELFDIQEAINSIPDAI